MSDERNKRIIENFFRTMKGGTMEKPRIPQGHYQHFFKCINCSLHFVLLSWYESLEFTSCPHCEREEEEVIHLKTETHPKEIWEITSLALTAEQLELLEEQRKALEEEE